jgi:hypothetical protein
MVVTNIQTFSGDVEVTSNLLVPNTGTASFSNASPTKEFQLSIGSNIFANAYADMFSGSNALTVHGRVGANLFVGDGGLLSNIATTLGDIVNQGNTVANVITFTQNATYDVGIVTEQGVGIGISNTSPSAEYQLTVGSNIFANAYADMFASSNALTVHGRIGANLFVGDGGLLSNIATTLGDIVNQGNAVSNTIIFESGADATSNTGIVTRANVGISVSNTEPSGEFQFGVGSTLFVNTHSSNVLTVYGNVNANTLTLGDLRVTTSYGLNHVTAQNATTGDTINLTNGVTGLSVTSNVVLGGNITASNAIISSNIQLGGRLSYDANVFVDTLRVADIAANLVTYDQSTGELLDSGGLFLNKIAIISEQPTSVLTANSTTVTNHGVYKLTTSNLATNSNTWNAFDGDAAVAWTSSSNYTGASNIYTEIGETQLSVVSSTKKGDWLAIEFPYKTTLRHMKFTPVAVASYPTNANVYATNDGISWTELVNWEGVVPGSASEVQTVKVNASEAYKRYALVATKAAGDSAEVSIAQWKLFAESFAIDGGKVAMASAAIMGGNTVVDQTGPHARVSPPLRKYPEVAMTSNVGVGGYVAEESNYSGYVDGYAWRLFNNDDDQYQSASVYSNGIAGSSTPTTTASDNTTHQGVHITLTLPNKIQLQSVKYKSSTYYARTPAAGSFLGSNNNSTWDVIGTFSGIETTSVGQVHNVDITNYASKGFYKYLRLVVTRTSYSITTGTPGAGGILEFGRLEYYGYEETSDPDTSVDTTITSVYNLPDTTGMKLYLDGDKGSTPTDYSGEGHTLTNNSESFSGNAWSFTSLATSNVTMSTGDLAMEGTHPHSVSLWFNAANVSSNATLFHVGTAAGEGDAKTSISLTESGHLGWIDGGDNQFLSSNTWHNLVYATQGGGGLRTCYLDGRKLGDAQVQDTFGQYPPFAMTGYSQGGYTVSSSGYNGSSGDQRVWLVFNTSTTDYYTFGDHYDNTTGNYTRSPASKLATIDIDGNSIPDGEFLKLEVPHKLLLQYITMSARTGQTNSAPRLWRMYGSNDDTNWKLLHNKTASTVPADTAGTNYIINASKGYKYFALVVTQNGGYLYCNIAELKYFGHKENDTTRFPVSSTVLKYPHIAMTGPAQRGYVASASSYYNSDLVPENGFDGLDVSLDYAWESGPLGTNTSAGNGRYSSGSTFNTSYLNDSPLYGEGGFQTTESSNTWTGEWLQIQLPHAINMTKCVFGNADGNSQWNDRIPTSGVILGSTNGSTWNFIQQFSSTLKDQTLVVSHTNYYKYFRIVGTTVGGTQTIMLIPEWELYGTEEDLDIVARVGEGLDGKVANFRVYDKYLHEEQALELWDAQKDQFGRATSSVVVHKGRLGVGTTEPEGALSVLDEPHESEEFPPRAMTGYETYMEGHGVFKASGNSNGSTVYRTFAKNGNLSWTTLVGATAPGNPYSSSTGYTDTTRLTSSLSSEIPIAPYLLLELPYKIKLSRYEWQTGEDSVYHINAGIREVEIWAQNTSDTTWKLVNASSTVTPTRTFEVFSQTVNSDVYYDKYAFVALRTNGNANGTIGEIRYFGTRERGQSTLHDGELKLTKNLTVPRIGPPLDADDTPQRDRLVVEYNTSTNSTENGMVRDTSGRGNDGLMVGGASYDATEKALVLDGTDDYLTPLTNLGISGDWVHSFSGWFKFDTFTTQNYLFTIRGPNTRNKTVTFRTETTGYLVSAWYGNNITWGPIETNKWYHICLTYPGSASANQKLYINGELQSITNLGSYSTEPLDIDIATVEDVRIGSLGDTTYYLDGSISNIKIYDVALTTDEVKRLYDMGRCDEGHHVVNFSKTRVGIGLGDGEAPRADLDVRGSIMSSGYILQQNVVCCRYINGGDQSVTNSAKIPFDGIVYDPNNLWSTASDAFVAPVAGVYLVHVNLMTDSSTSHDGNHEIYVNGSQFTPKLRGFGVVTGANNLRNANSHHMVPLQAGHELSIHSVLNGVWYGSTAYAHSHVSIHLISDI